MVIMVLRAPPGEESMKVVLVVRVVGGNDICIVRVDTIEIIRLVLFVWLVVMISVSSESILSKLSARVMVEMTSYVWIFPLLLLLLFFF